ncbi:efflux transporter outer membrane subunit [Methylomonas sp. LL1]|uniref:efflux transporter outer membrane subunit n=1 Tax=Methylomonas sp. LL1 TaxID=2785785 RepID=UPI0018C3923D|nr:efflux transporter outer membrane subunit [Methylomonas sp. LL1]QPK64221.1 efflux transporter outer membrane subunit [Methylomonas sp. LL1]
MKSKVLIVSLSLTACNLVPNFQQPALDIPADWREASTGPASQVDPQWWTAFGSAELERLIKATLAYNNDLAAAGQRVEQARAQAKIAGADLWPALGLEGDFSNTHNKLGDTQRKSALVSVAYEVDLWGANRAKRDAGQALLLSETYARDALQLVVMADVGQAYFNLLAVKERRRIAIEFLQNVNDVLAIVEARFQAGAISAVDLAQQRTEQASAQASLDLVVQQQTLAENALSILLGLSPGKIAEGAEQLADVRLPVINPQQPSSLVQRRPDVRQVEMQLQAANADIGIALAAFYPKLQLNLDTLLASPQPAGLALAMAANLAQPLFQGGRLEGGLEDARARNAELVEIYQQTLLTAFKEVEDSAAVRSQSMQRMRALAEAVNQAREAYRLSQEQYRVGAIDYQTLLNTQQSWLTAQNNQVQARLDVLVALVQLYKALGGGWRASS